MFLEKVTCLSRFELLWGRCIFGAIQTGEGTFSRIKMLGPALLSSLKYDQAETVGAGTFLSYEIRKVTVFLGLLIIGH